MLFFDGKEVLLADLALITCAAEAGLEEARKGFLRIGKNRIENRPSAMAEGRFFAYDKKNFSKMKKTTVYLLIFYKIPFIMCVCGEKCIEVVDCGEFPHFPHDFPQPGGESPSATRF